MAKVSKRQAERALATVTAKFAEGIEFFGPPKLYEPGFHADGWTIAWESGPENWVGYTFECPGVWFEPVNHWCLAVLRDE